MSEVLKERVRAVLARVQDPHTGTDLVSSGAVRGIGVDGDKVAVDLVLGYPALSWQPTLVAEVQRALADEGGVSAATVSVATRVAAHKVQKDLAPLANARMLLEALPPNARVHLVTYSRGGLVGEALARAAREGERS